MRTRCVLTFAVIAAVVGCNPPRDMGVLPSKSFVGRWKEGDVYVHISDKRITRIRTVIKAFECEEYDYEIVAEDRAPDRVTIRSKRVADDDWTEAEEREYTFSIDRRRMGLTQQGSLQLTYKFIDPNDYFPDVVDGYD